MHHKTTKERRKFKRYAGKEGAMVALVSADGRYLNLYRIVNISRGGLAFEHTSSAELEEVLPSLELLGIYRPPFWIRGVPYTIIRDHEWAFEGSDDIATSRCGLAFGKLSVRQMSMMVDFMERYAFVDAGQRNKRIEHASPILTCSPDSNAIMA
jgi:hypothetical protein